MMIPSTSKLVAVFESSRSLSIDCSRLFDDDDDDDDDDTLFLSLWYDCLCVISRISGLFDISRVRHTLMISLISLSTVSHTVLASGHISKYLPVSYTHLTLPTNREV